MIVYARNQQSTIIEILIEEKSSWADFIGEKMIRMNHFPKLRPIPVNSNPEHPSNAALFDSLVGVPSGTYLSLKGVEPESLTVDQSKMVDFLLQGWGEIYLTLEDHLMESYGETDDLAEVSESFEYVQGLSEVSKTLARQQIKAGKLKGVYWF